MIIDHVYYNTLIAARWIVWGMHHMRASCVENEKPCCWHRDSSDVINVLLLLALSITMAMICGQVSKIKWCVMGNLPSLQGHIVPKFARLPLPYSRRNAPQWVLRNQWEAPLWRVNIVSCYNLTYSRTELPIVGHIVCNNGQKSILIGWCPCVEWETDFSF